MAVKHSLEDVAEIGEGLDVVELCGFDKRADDGPAVGAAVGAGEQVVLATKGDRANGTLDGVVVEIDTAVIEEQAEGRPAGKGITDGVGKGAAGGDTGEFGLEELLQHTHQGPGALIANMLALFAGLATDGRLDGIEFTDASQRFLCNRRSGGFVHVVELTPCVMAWMPPLLGARQMVQNKSLLILEEIDMMNDIALVGLDIAKSVFQVHGADVRGRVVCRKRLRREEVEGFFRALPSCQIGIEACPGSHFWGRLLRCMGHDVRLLPAQYVRPYVKTNKNDAADAEAICEAMTRPGMRFVPIKEEQQQEILVFHRARDMLIRQRVQLSNAIRGHLAEFGIVGPSRAHNIGILTTMIEDPRDTQVPSVVRRVLLVLVAALRDVSAKIEQIEDDLKKVALTVESCRRLMTIPGVGIITATALVASMRDPGDFKSGRHFAAWLGLVPRQNSTGGVDCLGGISKRGNSYLRRLLVHGSRSVMRWRSKTWTWLTKLRHRRPANVAAVAIANKTARVVWALLAHGGTYGRPAQRTG